MSSLMQASLAAAAGAPQPPPAMIYTERSDRSETVFDRIGKALSGFLLAISPQRRASRLARIVDMVDRHGAVVASMDRAGLDRRAASLRVELRRHGLRDDVVARTFAVVRELAGREIGMRHFDVQLIGGFAMLKGMIAEMETGEGKTLTAILPASAAALSGIPVHVVTVNDYLAKRDAEAMGPVYRALGLTVGIVVHGMTPEQRRAAYLCDITYCTNKETAFDYLRDRLVLGRVRSNLHLKVDRLNGPAARTSRLVMRGLHFAIVDEADSVLIDEARTPLIISGETEPGNEREIAEQALDLVAPLEADRDFKLLADERRIELTDEGKQRLVELSEPLGGIWRGRLRREETACRALAAKHLYMRDEHYIVADGKVQIVDEYTGRIAADRSWSEGLHQLIEVKEGCETTGRKVPLARLTYQRFFRRYQRLAGMSGTARETAGELWTVFGLPVVRMPTNRPLRRTHTRPRICLTAESKWRFIAQRAAESQRLGRSVLIGTRSVGASEVASQFLTQAGIDHVVLSAAQDMNEAEIIARAGEAGRVTVATNMAGRGVDIKLADPVVELGGLHVIVSERHDAGRIDRQLAGRCGRQGDPGSVETVLSLDDPLLEILGSSRLLRVARLPGWHGQWAGRIAFDRAQDRAERLHSRMRRELVKVDQRLDTLLAFSGRAE